MFHIMICVAAQKEREILPFRDFFSIRGLFRPVRCQILLGIWTTPGKLILPGPDFFQAALVYASFSSPFLPSGLLKFKLHHYGHLRTLLLDSPTHKTETGQHQIKTWRILIVHCFATVAFSAVETNYFYHTFNFLPAVLETPLNSGFSFYTQVPCARQTCSSASRYRFYPLATDLHDLQNLATTSTTKFTYILFQFPQVTAGLVPTIRTILELSFQVKQLTSPHLLRSIYPNLN